MSQRHAKKVGGVTQKVSSVYCECYKLASMAYFSIIILSNARPNLVLDLFTIIRYLTLVVLIDRTVVQIFYTSNGTVVIIDTFWSSEEKKRRRYNAIVEHFKRSVENLIAEIRAIKDCRAASEPKLPKQNNFWSKRKI